MELNEYISVEMESTGIIGHLWNVIFPGFKAYEMITFYTAVILKCVTRMNIWPVLRM